MIREASGSVLFRGRLVPWRTSFSTDLQKLYGEELARRGQIVAAGADLSESTRLLHDLRRRRLEYLSGTRLKVLYSTEIRRQPRHAAIRKIADLARKGLPLWPYTSRRTKFTERDDALLNHWGITHFHLGEQLEGDGYVKRSSDLLFARITKDFFCIIGVFDHSSFEDASLLNIAIRNWPATFVTFQMRNGLVGGVTQPPQFVLDGRMKQFHRTILTHPTRDVSSGGTKRFRELGLNATFCAENGKHYAPPGGGYSCAGSGAAARVDADHELWWASQLADIVREHISAIAGAAEGREIPPEHDGLVFHLGSIDDMKEGIVIEGSTQTRINIEGVRFDYDFDSVAWLATMAAVSVASRSSERRVR